MSKPDDIPQDMLDLALKTYAKGQGKGDGLIHEIARAILNERERCADIADQFAAQYCTRELDDLAAALRKGSA